MLTIGANIMPNSGIKFQPKNQTNQNLCLNNALLAKSSFDTFSKSNNNLNFTGIFSKKPLPKLGAPTTNKEISVLEDALVERTADIWDWMKTQPKYAGYFDDLKMTMPSIRLVRPEKNSEECKEDFVSRYNWAENRITINLSQLPNIALITGDGNVAIVPRDMATSFIRKTPGLCENDFEDLEDKSAGFALQSGRETGRNYFYKLSAEETAELATQYLVQELDRAVAFHVLLNTRTIGAENELINRYYNNLKDNGRLQPETTGYWIDTYPCEYKELNEVRKTYPVYGIDGSDRWIIASDKKYHLPSISHKDLYNEFINTDNLLEHKRSLLELGGLIASERFMKGYTPKGRDERDRERLEIFYKVQKMNLEADIEERIKIIKERR